MRSLSDDATTTGVPSLTAISHSVAMTSSASTPGTRRYGNPNASAASVTSANCGSRSSGGGDRFALYSSQMACRHCGPPWSPTSTTSVRPPAASAGSARLASALHTPSSAPTGVPSSRWSAGMA